MVKKIWDEIVGGVKDILRELASDEVLRDTFGIQDNNNSKKKYSLEEMLMTTFTEEVKKGETNYLIGAVERYKSEVHRRKDNVDLLKAHAKAAVFVDKPDLAYESLALITNPNPKQNCAMGFLAYRVGDYGRAVEHFQRCFNNVHSANLAYSSSLLVTGEHEIAYHEMVLKPLMNKLETANTILGTLNYNAGQFGKAEKYFRKAEQLSPRSEQAALNMMRVKMITHREGDVYAQMSTFYVTTGSKLDQEQLSEELSKLELDFPKPKVANLYDVVDSLV
jgi:Flp pilus assembly protein TadD